jgi:hypothetical protein
MPARSILATTTLAVVLLAAAGFAPVVTLAASAPAVASSGATDAAGCPTRPLSVAELLRLWDGEPAGFLGMTSPRGRACFGRSDVVVFGYVNAPDGMGGTSAVTILPSWLTENGLMLYGSSREVGGYPAGDAYVVAMPPGFGDLQMRYRHRWVQLVAHFDDARARTCHAVGPKDAQPPSRKEAVRLCRSILVLSSINTTSVPDTAAAMIEAKPGVQGSPAGVTAILPLAGVVGALAWLARDRGRRRERPSALAIE